jgi:hypothetical protein
MTGEARCQSRLERVGICAKLYSRCSIRVARHHVGSDRLCCHCYVGRGYPPANWHPECLVAAAALRKTNR